MEIWKTFLLFCAVVVTVTSAIMRDNISSEPIVVDAYKNDYNNLRRLVESYAKILKDQVNVGISAVSSACKKEIILKLLRAEEETLNTLETELKALRYECKTLPPGVEHATVTVRKVNLTQQVAKYTCDIGYTYGGGNKEVLCDGDYGVWNSVTMQCIECFTTASTYQGNKNITQGGIPCQRWDSQSPHQHYIISSYLPDKHISSAENYCRTPEFSEPWCYTVDPKMEWDYCGIPNCNRNCKKNLCKDENDCSLPQSLTNAKLRYTYTSFGATASYVCNSLSGSTQNSYCPVSQCTTTGWTAVSISCSEHDCFRDSSEYTGKRSCTISGRICQKWAKTFPHDHSKMGGYFPDGSAANASNYCRAPDRSATPWCYTIDHNVRYEMCDVPSCDKFP